MSKFSSDLFSCISDSFLNIVGFPLVCEVFRISILLRRWFIQLFKVCDISVTLLTIGRHHFQLVTICHRFIPFGTP